MADYYVDESGNLKKKKDEPDYYIDENGNQITKETVLVKDLPIAPAQTGDGKWLKWGAFEDGWQFGDLTKTILGTTRDVKENVTHAVLEATENLIDTTAFGVGQVAGWFGADGFRDNVGEFIAKDPLTKGEMGANFNKVLDFTTPEGLISKAIIGDNTEGNSILGDKSDGLVQSGAHLVGSKALQMVGVPSAVTMGVNAFGSEIEQAYKNDATHNEALISGAVAAGAEILIEKISSGIKFGGKTLDEGAAKGLSRRLSNRIVRSILKWTGDTAGEGLEEYLTESATNVARKLTYADEMTLKDILWSEEHLDAFVGGAIMGGAAGGYNATKAGVNGVEYASGLTANEEKVVRHEYEKRIAEKTKNGEKVDKAKIWDEVIKDMEKGYISTDTIEEVLGDKSYDNLKQEADEFNTLYNKEGGMSKAQQDRLAELEAKNKSKPYKALLEETKKKRTESVRSTVRFDRLGESYREADRVYESFQIDPDKYKGRKHEDAAKKTIQSAIDAGANNTNRVHDLVEMAASVSADTGKTFTFKSGEDIKNDFIERQTAEIAKLEAIKNRTSEQDAELAEMESLLAKVKSGEVIVDGDITEDGIVLNLDSNKPLNRVVGHEITHHFEPGKGKNSKYYTELRDSLFAYAKTKGRDIDAELAVKKAQYAGVTNANAEAELVADLVGDFLFTDLDYIKKLSVENRNVFQKLWDGVKYLAKVATAGSKEARELARLEKAFADIYRESAEKNTADGGHRYSLLVKDKDGNVSAVNPYVTTREQTKDFLVKSRKGELDQYTYFPVSAHIPGTVITTLNNAGIEITDKPLAMQAKKARQSQIDGQHIERDGTVIRHHALTPSEIQEAIDKLEDPIVAIHQEDRVKKKVEEETTIYVPAPDNFVFFVTLDSGKEVVAVIEFDSFINDDMIQKDGQGDEYHTTVTVFEPDKYRDGEEFDYAEYLAVQQSNTELEIIKESPKTETAISQTQATVSESELSAANVAQKKPSVKRKYSLSSIANTFFGDENMTAEQFKKADYRQTQGYKDYVDQCVNNLRQTDPNFDEGVARQNVESSIEGIVQVAIAAKEAGYDIYDDAKQRSTKDSKNRLLFSSLEPNSDYFTSNDISTICDKRKNFADIYDDIVRAEEAKGVPVGKRFFDNVDNYFYLHKLMADKGLTQPCRQCYVESMRKNLAPMANAFLRLVQETNPDNTANDQLYHQSGKQKGELKTSNASTREFVLSAMAEHPEYGLSAENLTVEMLTTEDGLAQLKIQAPLIYEAFNSFYGQSKPKMPKSATPFRFGELTALLTDEKGRIKKSLVDKINSTGGFRLQSYSDFQIQNYTDVLQVLFEAGTLGLNGHAYTKVPAFLEATEGTNLKRNISIFMYKDGNEWKLDKNDSFPYSLEEIYDIVKADKTGNTGVIAVSQNADMSAWIMANDFIAYGIPFHKSGSKMGTVRDTDVKTDDGRIIKGYSGTIDHTKQQTEVWAKATEDHKALTKVKKGINIYSFWDFDNKSNLSKNELIEKNVKAYIDACEMAGYLPKFRAYVMDNSKVLNDVLKYSKELGFVGENATIEDISFQYKGYTIPYGYYKFLGDFGMFTPDGKASPQETLSLKNYDFDKAVQFFADSETLRRNEILQQFANGEERDKYRNSNLTAEQLQEIVKRKRGEIAQDVVSRHANSLSNEGDDVFAPSENDIYGSDFRMQEIAPVQETAPTQEESVAPVAEDDLAPAEDTNIDSLTDKDAPMGDIAPVRVLVRKKINKPMKTVKPDDSTGAAPSGFDPVSHLQYEHGSLPVGENPVREDSLPKSTTGKDKVSLTARTVKGAESTPDEFVDLLDKEVVGGRFSYLPIKNTDTVKKSYDSIVQKGWEAARGEWESRVRRGEVSAELSATGELLLNNAAKAGDRKAWLSILHDYQVMGTNAGQAIQAMRILKTLTPDDGLYMIERSVEQMVEDMKLGTEIVIDEDLKQKYLDSKTDSEKDAALDALAKNVASQIPSTAMDKWTALRYLNMLGNLRTQGRNIFGNLGMSATNRLKNTIASFIEAIAEKVSGGKFKRTKSAFVGRGLLKASKNDFAYVEQVALNGGKFNDSMSKSVQFQQKVQDSRKIFNGIFMPLEQYRRATNWAMSQGDLVFSKAAYGRALAGYLKANGITETDFSKIDQQTLDEARAYAVKEAQEVTFRDNNWLSDWVSKMGRRKDTPKVGKLISEGVMPFRKTPANILLRAEEYSPLGILNATAKSIKAVKGDISGAEVVNSWAKALTGTGLFALGMLLNNLGVLSGGPDDDENKEQFENQYGQQNYALKIGDYSFTIDFLSPSAMPLLMGAQLNELRQDKDVELKDLETSLMSIADPMIEMSMLQGVNDSLDNIRYAESNMGQFLVNSCVNYLTQGLTNSFLGQLERSFEGERMTTYIDKDSKTPQWLQKALGKASAKTPGWDYQQVPYVDAWGETEDIAPLPGVLENTLSPSYISHEMTDDVYDELNRLNDAQSDINVYPQTPDKTVTFDDADGNRHVDYNLTAEEYVELSQLQGQTQKELVEDIMSSELYDGLTDKEKAKAVQLAYQYAKEYSRQEVLGADGFSSKWMSEAGDDIVNAIIAHVSDEKTFAYNYPEKYSFFMSNGISYEQYASADEAGKRAYTLAYENPGKYKMYQKLSGDYMTFYGYKSDLNGIKSDKDSSGKPITGSRKEKIIEYINNMDADYGEKIILYKSEYPSDDTYNNDIVEYLNSRNDISYDDMVTILKELGFTVDKNGNVSW